MPMAPAHHHRVGAWTVDRLVVQLHRALDAAGGDQLVSCGLSERRNVDLPQPDGPISAG